MSNTVVIGVGGWERIFLKAFHVISKIFFKRNVTTVVFVVSFFLVLQNLSREQHCQARLSYTVRSVVTVQEGRLLVLSTVGSITASSDLILHPRRSTA